jgi:hypothetical protein
MYCDHSHSLYYSFLSFLPPPILLSCKWEWVSLWPLHACLQCTIRFLSPSFPLPTSHWPIPCKVPILCSCVWFKVLELLKYFLFSILLLCWKFLPNVIFLVESFGIISSVILWLFASIYVPFIPLLSHFSGKSGESGLSCLIPDYNGNDFSFSPSVWYWLWVCHVYPLLCWDTFFLFHFL